MERGDAVKNFMEEFRETAPLCSRKLRTGGINGFHREKNKEIEELLISK